MVVGLFLRWLMVFFVLYLVCNVKFFGNNKFLLKVILVCVNVFLYLIKCFWVSGFELGFLIMVIWVWFNEIKCLVIVLVVVWLFNDIIGYWLLLIIL